MMAVGKLFSAEKSKLCSELSGGNIIIIVQFIMRRLQNQ